MARKDGARRRKRLTGTAPERLKTAFSICEFALSHSREETKEKYPDLSGDMLKEYIWMFRNVEKIRKFLTDGKEPIDFLYETGAGPDTVRAMATFSDGALQDAVNALSCGGKVSRSLGIVWPDGRKRPIDDCRTTKKREHSQKNSQPGQKTETPAAIELAELIAAAAGTFDASIRQYISDYRNVEKREAVLELQKAEKIIAGWIERMQ